MASKKTAKKKTTKSATKAAKQPGAKRAAVTKTVKKTAKKGAAKKTAKKVATKKTAQKAATKKTAKKLAGKKTAKKAATKKTAKKVAGKKAAKKAATKKSAKKAATKKTAKKAAAKKTEKSAGAKKTVKTTATTAPGKASSAAVGDVVALPARRLPQAPVALPAQRLAAPSSAAAVTIVPEDGGGDEVDDALDEAVGAAFDSVFLPVTTPPAAPFEPGDPAEDLAQACAALALEKKADDVVVLRVAELTSYADFFVIAQAPSDRQVQAIARNVTEALKKRGKTPMSTDGLEQGNWVIVDYGSVVLHVFLASARSYYDLDGFWVDAPRIAVDEARGQGALAAMS